MQIRYSLTRTEAMQSFVQGVVRSPKLLVRVLLYCLMPGFIGLLTSGELSHAPTAAEVMQIIAWTVGAFCLMVVLMFVRAKTNERVLIMNEEGISTSIGKLKGEVPGARSWT